MKHSTSYRVRALGTLWDGSQTWGEVTTSRPVTETMHGPAMETDGTLAAVFPDWSYIADFEVIQTRALTQVWKRLRTRYTSIHETGTTFRPWSDAGSEGRWHDLQSYDPTDEETVKTLLNDLNERSN